MSDIQNKVKDLCEKYKLPQRHTDFQIEHFIVGKECSIYGKVWQCIRELQTRLDTLDAIDMELEELHDSLNYENLNLKKLQYKLQDKPDENEDIVIFEIKQEKRKIQISRQKRKIFLIGKNIEKTHSRKADVLAESAKFSSLLEEIINDSSFVDINDPNAQLEFWNSKFHAELNLTAMLNHPINPELVKSVLALPNESQAKIQLENALNNVGKKLLNQSK